MNTEVWRPAPGHPNYEVSSEGRLRSIHKGRVLGQVVKSNGYLYVAVTPTRVLLHRLVAAAFLGPCPKGQEVRHLDGDRLNCAITNLKYGTRSENIRDQVIHGTHAQARKTRCPRGHLLLSPNLIERRLPARRCLACARTGYHLSVAHPDFKHQADRVYAGLMSG